LQIQLPYDHYHDGTSCFGYFWHCRINTLYTHYTYIIHTLSEDIKCIYTSWKPGQKSMPCKLFLRLVLINYIFFDNVRIVSIYNILLRTGLTQNKDIELETYQYWTLQARFLFRGLLASQLINVSTQCNVLHISTV
jgi:hypothetical protein